MKTLREFMDLIGEDAPKEKEKFTPNTRPELRDLRNPLDVKNIKPMPADAKRTPMSEPVIPQEKLTVGFDDLPKMKPEVKQLADLFTQQANKRGVKNRRNRDSYGGGLEALTPNGFRLGITVGAGDRLPDNIRFTNVSTGKKENTANAREELYAGVRKLLNLPFAFKDGNWLDGVNPTFPLRQMPEPAADVESILNTYWTLFDGVSKLGSSVTPAARGQEDFEPKVYDPTKKKTKDKDGKKTTPFHYYNYMALKIYNAVNYNQPTDLDRKAIGLDADQSDPEVRKMVVKGITAKGYALVKQGRMPYREHAVPSKLLLKTGVEMVKAGKKNGDSPETIKAAVAKMLRNNLIIVYCDDAEGKLMDRGAGDERGRHQSTVPDNTWNETNNDLLARFRHFDIPVYAYNPETKQPGEQIAEELTESTPDYRNLMDLIDQGESLPHAPVRPEPVTDNPKILGRKKRALIVPADIDLED